ncbi:SAF domain-containing protein [Agromyces bauzanensis]
MTATADKATNTRRGAAKGAPKAPKPESRVRSRPRPAIIAMAIALIIVGGLAAAYIYTTTGRTVQVLSASAAIARGHVIESGDLTAVEIPEGQSIPSFTVVQAKEIIGQYAVVDIPQGTLISPNNVAAEAGVPAGQSIVGIALTQAQLPPYPLANGDPVRIVETPINQGDPPATTPPSIEATVVTVTVDETSGNTIVAVAVDEDRAADLAARAATGRVALVLDAVPGE